MNMILYLYLFGVAYEFIRTTMQINMLENEIGFVTKELKLNKIELFIAILIISLGWMVVEPIMLMNSRNN